MSQFKKKIKPGLIELDSVEPVIIVHFVTNTVDTTAEGPDGKPLVVESVPDVKKFRLSKFHAASNAQKFAEVVQKQSPLIHESKIPLLVGLLEQLRERLIDQAGSGGGEDPLAATAPPGMSGLGLAKVASVPGHAARDGAGAGGYDGGNGGGGMDLRASAPTVPSAKQRAQPSQRQTIDEQAEDDARRAQDEHDDMRRSSVRPGSAARSRGAAPAPSPLDTRGDGFSGPAASASPVFGNGGGSKLQQQQAQAQQQAQQQQQQQQQQQRAPLTAEEEEEMERQRALKREREERMQREARKARNAKRAESALSVAFKSEQDRLAQMDRRESARKKKEKEKSKKSEVASLKRLDEYIETLYEEDMAHKVRGTALILQLVQHPEHLDHFIDNDTVLGALARVLKEDYKRSPELVTNILEIFFCFSSFRQLHPILLQNKIGETTMRVIELEIKRYELRREKEEKARLDAGGAPCPSNNPLGDISTHYATPGVRESSEEKDRSKKLTAFLLAQEKLLFVCFYILLNLAEDFAIELRIRNKKIVKHLVAMLLRTGAPHAEDRGFLDELHLLVLTFLKKLSIFEENKREMKEHEVVRALAVFLNNHSPPLSPAQAAGLEPLPATCTAPNPEVLEAVLRLLYNLSFEPEAKREMALSLGGLGGGWTVPKNFGKPSQQLVALPAGSGFSPPGSPTAAGGSQQQLLLLGGQSFQFDRELNPSNLVVRCVDLLKRPSANVRIVASRVLYNLSSDLAYRPLVERALYPDVSVLASLILRCPSKLVDKELIALAVNITWSAEMVDAFVSPEVFYALVKRVHQTFDPLLVKLLRNISQLPEQQGLFKKFLHELVGMTLKAPTHDFLVEALAVLANITLPDVLYSELMAQHGLLDFLMTHLQPGFADDDVVLECVQLLGTLALDPRAAPLLAHGHLVRSLTQLLTDKIEDLDLVVHIVFALFKFLLHRETREAIMLHQHLTDCLLDLVVDPSPEVRHLANMCLDIIMEHDDVWRDKIRAKRFEAFNREWLQLIANSGAGHMADSMGGGGGGGMMGHGHGHDQYDNSMGMQDSMEDSQESMGQSRAGMGAYGYAAHDPMGELGDSATLDRYQHDQSRDQDSLEDSEDMSQR